MYMELPIGLDAPDVGKRYYVMKLSKSLYVLKQASANWFETLKAGFGISDQWYSVAPGLQYSGNPWKI